MLRLRENWFNYSKHSTIGALSHISHGSSKHEQKFWIVANCFAILITVVQVCLIFGRFLQFEVISTVEVGNVNIYFLKFAWRSWIDSCSSKDSEFEPHVCMWIF